MPDDDHQSEDRPALGAFRRGAWSEARRAEARVAARNLSERLRKEAELTEELAAEAGVADPETVEAFDKLVEEKRPRSPYERGDHFVLDDPDELEAVWGHGEDVLWAKGEAVMLCGPQGVGKTTLAVQLVASLLEISDSCVGFPVRPAEGRVLYLAMDRPSQVRRAMKRHFGEERYREVLRDHLTVRKGHLPLDLGKVPEQLIEMTQQHEATTVVLDSVKDAVVNLNDTEAAANFNRAIQLCVNADIEVLALHHQRKGQGGHKPTTLEDVYGNTWLTAGMGSVVLLWGAAGDPLVELSHLKQPSAEVGPLTIEHDQATGGSSVYRGFDALAYLRHHPGTTAVTAARAQFEKADPTENEQRKTRRLFEGLVRRGLAKREEPSVGGAQGGAKGSSPARYFTVDPRNEMT